MGRESNAVENADPAIDVAPAGALLQVPIAVNPPSSTEEISRGEAEASETDEVGDYLDRAQERLRSKQLSILVLRALKLTWSANRAAFLMAAGGQLFRAVMASAIVLVGSRAVSDLLAVSQGGISLSALTRIRG
jgi:hypothetical protein